jgi:WD40 repeat protein
MVSSSLRFRYLLGESTNPLTKFQDVKQTTSNQEHDGIATNGTLTAMGWTQNSSIAVFSTYDFKRFDANIPLIKGHNGAITDLGFSPFHETLLASASEDGLVKLWVLPEEGLTEHIKEEDMELRGHTKKVLALRWHHIAENLMATYSFDNNVKIWDVSAGTASHSFTKLSNVPTAMQWSPKGNMLGLMLKGSTMTFIDPRVETSVLSGASH